MLFMDHHAIYGPSQGTPLLKRDRGVSCLKCKVEVCGYVFAKTLSMYIFEEIVWLFDPFEWKRWSLYLPLYQPPLCTTYPFLSTFFFHKLKTFSIPLCTRNSENMSIFSFCFPYNAWPTIIYVERVESRGKTRSTCQNEVSHRFYVNVWFSGTFSQKSGSFDSFLLYSRKTE